jgi:hypothetical protein
MFFDMNESVGLAGSCTLANDATRQGGKFCRWRFGRVTGICKAATGAKAMFLESLG